MINFNAGKSLSIKEIDNENDLDNILIGNERVFVLFYSSWCPFCRSFLPIFNKYAQKREDKKFLRVKIDRFLNPIWEKYSVNVVPTVILFQGNNVFRRLNGVLGVGLNEKQFNCFLDFPS
jgi:thiol-disulfide isomerase/thioredoxin